MPTPGTRGPIRTPSEPAVASEEAPAEVLEPTHEPAETVPERHRDAAGPDQNDKIVLFGLNAFAAHEVTGLRSGGAQVKGLLDTTTEDSIVVNGSPISLSDRITAAPSADGIQRFVTSLGLSEEQNQKLSQLIESAPKGSRDELAQLAQVWAKAERGGQIASRLVISGHHAAGDFFSDQDEEVSVEALVQLAQIMPQAAHQICDLHLSACNSSPHLEVFKQAFPNLKTFWAYDGSAPSTFGGAINHLQQWEKATRGNGADLHPKVAKGRKSQNVATWNLVSNSLKSRRSQDIDDLTDQVREVQPALERYHLGVGPRPPTAQLRQAYRALSQLSGRAAVREQLNSQQLSRLHELRDQALRLLAYDNFVRGAVQREFGREIREGFQSVGLEAPDFSILSRREALQAIAELRTQVEFMDSPDQAAVEAEEILERTVVQLSAEHVPTRWLSHR